MSLATHEFLKMELTQETMRFFDELTALIPALASSDILVAQNAEAKLDALTLRVHRYLANEHGQNNSLH